MFSSRNLIEEKNIQEYLKKIEKEYKDLSKIEFPLNNEKTASVTFIDSKITSLKKIDNIENIVQNDKHNIFVVSKIQNKIWETLISYNIEIFFKHEFMINLIDHDLIPEHQLLSEEEKSEILGLYDNQINKLPSILLYDPVSRYFNANINDIFRIKRPSITSGYTVYYRVVKKGPLPDIK